MRSPSPPAGNEFPIGVLFLGSLPSAIVTSLLVGFCLIQIHQLFWAPRDCEILDLRFRFVCSGAALGRTEVNLQLSCATHEWSWTNKFWGLSSGMASGNLRTVHRYKNRQVLSHMMSENNALREPWNYWDGQPGHGSVQVTQFPKISWATTSTKYLRIRKAITAEHPAVQATQFSSNESPPGFSLNAVDAAVPLLKLPTPRSCRQHCIKLHKVWRWSRSALRPWLRGWSSGTSSARTRGITWGPLPWP